MPYKRNYKNRKRPYRRRFRRRRNTRRKYNRKLIQGGFPATKMVKLRYVSQIQLTPDIITGPTVKHVFSANGMYDPEPSASFTLQPMNFDQWMAFYKEYQVVGSRITVKYVPSQSGDQQPAIVGITTSDNGLLIQSTTTLANALELSTPKTKYMFVGNANSGGKTISYNYSQKRYHGTNAIGLADYKGTQTYNPSNSTLWEVFATVLNANDPPELNLIVTIDYIAKLTEPLHQAQSS